MKKFNFTPSRKFSFQDMYDSLTPEPEPEPEPFGDYLIEGRDKGTIELIEGGSTVILNFQGSGGKGSLVMMKAKDWNALKTGKTGQKVKAEAAIFGLWESAPLNEAALPSQYANKIKGIPSKAFDWFMKYQTQFDKKDFGFKKLNISKVSVNTSALTDKQRGRIVAKLGFKNHKSQASALEKIIASAREKWSDIQTLAHMETYGEKPGFGSYKVSGIGDNKYSDIHKKQLRTLAHMENVFKNARDAHKAAAKLTEGSTENALGTLKAIIGSLKGRNDATGKDMFKMAVGIKDYYDKEKSFSPDQASWIFKMSKMFKK
jgi:hypothetical protein